jgi:hypothetical protein
VPRTAPRGAAPKADPFCHAAVMRWSARNAQLSAAEAMRRKLPELIGDCGRGADILNRDPAYLCKTQVLSKKDRNETAKIPCPPALQGFLPDENAEGLAPQRPTIQTVLGETPITAMMGPALRALGESSRLPAGKRWRGRLGPSLFMTAVEVAPPAAGMREHGETAGRNARRLLAMTAEQRARNDLPPTLGTDPAGAAGRREAIRDYCREAAAATALVPSAKSAQAESSHGWKGLTPAGRRSIRDAGAVLDEDFGSLGFFTVTLTDKTAATASREQIADFQSRLLYMLRRQLGKVGLAPMVLLVAEMHPHRKSLDGSPVPHWHGVVKVSPGPYQRWLLRKEHFNRAVLKAYKIAFGHERGHTQRLQLVPQKTGSARYLSKYIAKGGSDVESLRDSMRGRMVPSQWWTWTGELRLLVTACRTRPPAAFLRWCVRWRRELEDLGEVRTGDCQIPFIDPLCPDEKKGPVIGCWFVWRSEAALDRAIRAWIEAELSLMDDVPEGWADADGAVRYGFDGDLPEGVAPRPPLEAPPCTVCTVQAELLAM